MIIAVLKYEKRRRGKKKKSNGGCECENSGFKCLATEMPRISSTGMGDLKADYGVIKIQETNIEPKI